LINRSDGGNETAIRTLGGRPDFNDWATEILAVIDELPHKVDSTTAVQSRSVRVPDARERDNRHLREEAGSGSGSAVPVL